MSSNSNHLRDLVFDNLIAEFRDFCRNDVLLQKRTHAYAFIGDKNGMSMVLLPERTGNELAEFILKEKKAKRKQNVVDIAAHVKTVETSPQQTPLWTASHSLSQSLGKLFAPINRVKKFTTLSTTACGGFFLFF